MEPERNEVYERIPWETLEEKKPDRQWLMLAVAGAIVLGSLAYAWTSSRAAPGSATTTATLAQPSTVAATSAPAVSAVAVTPAPAQAPVLTAEADLYAVHPERAIDKATAHAEWFVAEYLTVDGSEESRTTLSALLPAGVPLPVAAEGSRVFVEWVRSIGVEEIGELTYRVTVLARSLAAAGGDDYVRQTPLRFEVDVSVTDSGPQVITPPMVGSTPVGEPHPLQLTDVPEDVAASAVQGSGGNEVIGGFQAADGAWQVIVMAPGADGVVRPVTVPVPAA